MFQACEVKIAKIDAHSKPSSEPGNNAMNPVMVIARNPNTGTDCKNVQQRNQHLLGAA